MIFKKEKNFAEMTSVWAVSNLAYYWRNKYNSEVKPFHYIFAFENDMVLINCNYKEY